jgi:adenine-specific DNA-methyltransferase
MKKTKLELTWIGKDKRPRLEPRILLEDKELSHRAEPPPAEDLLAAPPAPIYDNLLIHGDNLLALKALERDYAGQVKCVFIDPPYNTGSAFSHYDDGLEHSLWLSLMRDRLELIRSLLAEDGSLWITIDDNECHYLKVLCDEVFGRGNFVANVVWQKKYAVANDHKTIAPMHDHVLVYRKSESWQRNLLPRGEEKDRQYKFEDDKGIFRPDNYTCNKTAEERPNLYYAITQPNTGEEIWPKKTAVWRYSQETHMENERNGLIYWGKDGKGRVPAYKRYRHLLKNAGLIIPGTWWTFEDASHTDAARKEVRAVLGSTSLTDDFITPKPEGLIQRVLEIATNPNDLVLDSFAGSGTTGAVAHKMGRRWIMVELGEHCRTHIVPRLKKVIAGQDPGGVTKITNWRGGGGFRYLRLAPSLLKKDTWGNWVINPDYNPEMLAEAMCKHMGFSYAPSQEQFWNHGYSGETDFIYVTTGSLTRDQLKLLSEAVGEARTLLICGKAFLDEGADFPNLTLKKIPQAVLNKCEWDQDDYSFSLNLLGEADEA